MQALFGALRRCKDLDLKGCTLLDGSIFAALAGTPAALTDLNCEDIGTVRPADRGAAGKGPQLSCLQAPLPRCGPNQPLRKHAVRLHCATGTAMAAACDGPLGV